MKNSLRTFLSKEGQQAMKILNLNVQKSIQDKKEYFIFI